MKTKFAALALGTATLLGATAVQAIAAQDTIIAAAPQTQSGEATQPGTTATPSYNLFDPKTWSDASGPVKPGEMVEFDPANPRSWAMAMDPKTHFKVHMTVTNPQFYAQFMTPAYYMKFMNPKTWMSYLDISTYDSLLKVVSDPQTAKYWLQPGAYMHGMNPSSYSQMADPGAYAGLASTVAGGYGVDTANTAANMFNPFNWMKQFADATSAMTPAEVKKPQ